MSLRLKFRGWRDKFFTAAPLVLAGLVGTLKKKMEKHAFNHMKRERYKIATGLVQGRLKLRPLAKSTIEHKEYIAKRGWMDSSDVKIPLVRYVQIANAIRVIKEKMPDGSTRIMLDVSDKVYFDKEMPIRTHRTIRDLYNIHQADGREIFTQGRLENAAGQVLRRTLNDFESLIGGI